MKNRDHVAIRRLSTSVPSVEKLVPEMQANLLESGSPGMQSSRIQNLVNSLGMYLRMVSLAAGFDSTHIQSFQTSEFVCKSFACKMASSSSTRGPTPSNLSFSRSCTMEVLAWADIARIQILIGGNPES